MNCCVRFGQLLAHHRHLLGGADAGDHVLALGVDQVLAVDGLLAGAGVAGERHAGAGGVAHVAEDHGHDVDRGAQVVGDALVVAVVERALAVPALEDGLGGQAELLDRVLGEVETLVLLDDRLVLARPMPSGSRWSGRCPSWRRPFPSCRAAHARTRCRGSPARPCRSPRSGGGTRPRRSVGSGSARPGPRR